MPRFHASIRRAVFMGVSLMMGGGFSAPARAQDEVSITLGTTNTEKGITLKEPDGGSTSVVSKGGSSVRSTAPSAGKTGGTMNFSVDQAFSSEGSSPDLYLSVEYFDEGTDQFRLEYDSIGDDPELAAVKATETLAKYNTKRWLTYTFHISDAFFGDRQPGEVDFRINDLTVDPTTGEATEGEAAESIRKISISKKEPIPLHIKFAGVPVKIDGILDDLAWRDAQVFQVNSASQDVIRPSKWQGVEDYSLDAKFAWDSQFLYIAFDVNDDVPRVNADDPGTAFKGDSAEVYFGFDQSKPSRTAYIKGQDFQIDTTAGPNPVWGIFSGGTAVPPPDDSPWKAEDHVKIVDRPKGYILEARIPWAMLIDEKGEPHKSPAPGQRVGFNVFANDGDDPEAPSQELAMGFTGRPGAWGNPSAWATVVMDPPSPTAMLGDLNGDQKINVQDATLSLRISVGSLTPTEAQKTAGDVNKDGKWNVQDTTLILRRGIGAIPKFPGE